MNMILLYPLTLSASLILFLLIAASATILHNIHRVTSNHPVQASPDFRIKDQIQPTFKHIVNRIFSFKINRYLKFEPALIEMVLFSTFTGNWLVSIKNSAAFIPLYLAIPSLGVLNAAL